MGKNPKNIGKFLRGWFGQAFDKAWHCTAAGLEPAELFLALLKAGL